MKSAYCFEPVCIKVYGMDRAFKRSKYSSKEFTMNTKLLYMDAW
eukprot:CAMPEP_0115739534 /NCGR_PEP_ID=MMETSP0272-20121206/88992_1 /TAXON_ID=71861 /ORGANISM="Scrippsiella trochoidea, Strain CCMP3099" /LENGTH=43 /DNA_ID= /DNA_START= /DNA_END= /DNA_ORIENTATION=